jgi:hypothetical protein
MPTVAGHRVVVGRRTADGLEVTFVRQWWAPFSLAWMAAGMVPWWLAPYVFVRMAFVLARRGR